MPRFFVVQIVVPSAVTQFAVDFSGATAAMATQFLFQGKQAKVRRNSSLLRQAENTRELRLFALR